MTDKLTDCLNNGSTCIKVQGEVSEKWKFGRDEQLQGEVSEKWRIGRDEQFGTIVVHSNQFQE